MSFVLPRRRGERTKPPLFNCGSNNPGDCFDKSRSIYDALLFELGFADVGASSGYCAIVRYDIPALKIAGWITVLGNQ